MNRKFVKILKATDNQSDNSFKLLACETSFSILSPAAYLRYTQTLQYLYLFLQICSPLLSTLFCSLYKCHADSKLSFPAILPL